jgi:hypothetical protein
MDKRQRPNLSFNEMVALRIAEGLSEDEAWRQALYDWHMDRGETAAARMVANAAIAPEIPLPAPILRPGLPTPPGARTVSHTLSLLTSGSKNSH